MKHIYSILFAFLLLMASATVALADTSDQDLRCSCIPEVPFALVYPVAGLVSFGLYKVYRGQRK